VAEVVSITQSAADTPAAGPKNTHRLESDDEESAVDVTALMKEARQVAIAQTGDFYLGTTNIRTQVQWY
jgi:hypothetical protein